MPKKAIIVVCALAIFVFLAFILKSKFINHKSALKPTPTPEFAQQLAPDQQPKMSLIFSADAHYVTVNISNLHADQLEYNLIYNATVKGNQIQTGVNASAKISGQSDYSQKQLLGSESSGKFTYHANITNAELDLTLRNVANQSIFTAIYPFTVSPGSSVDLKPDE